ncbi:MAG: Maf family nucleotide pyrophosphatase [Phycisphaerales bacterium]
MSTAPTLVLASSSPRRRQLLEEAGYRPRILPPDIDDGELEPPEASRALEWVASLAHLKARSVYESLTAAERSGSLVLGSDTVVIKRGAIIGQPASAEHARAIIEGLREGCHVVASGVALLSTTRRSVFVDTTRVRVGAIPDQEIDRYLESGEWRGKAGAYNYADRLAAGWDLSCEGDPTTIMGLPMRRLKIALDEEGIRV